MKRCKSSLLYLSILSLTTVQTMFSFDAVGTALSREEIIKTIQNSDAAKISALNQKIENLWPNDKNAYFYSLVKFCEAFMPFSALTEERYQYLRKAAFEGLNKLDARKLTEDMSVLSDQVRLVDLAIDAAFHAPNSNFRDDEIFNGAKIAAKFYGQIQYETNHAPAAPVGPSANVAPPPGPGPSFAGMNPDSISDPLQKEAYEKAIEDNAQVEMNIARQKILLKLKITTEQPLIKSLKILAADPNFKDNIPSLLKVAGLSETDITDN